MTRWPAALGVLAVTFALAACSPGDDTPENTPDPSTESPDTPAEPVEITFWHGYTEADGDVLEDLIQEFNDSQDQVTITTELNTWAVINDTFLPALSAGNGPELVALPPEMAPVYAERGAFHSLEDWYADGSKNPGSLNPAATEMSVVDGVNYGVPLSFTPVTMFYNKALFEAGDVEVPTTWDEWVAAAEALTIDENGDGTPEQYGIALQDHATVGNGVWASLFKSGGGDIVSDGEVVIDSPENKATLEFWVDAVRNENISPGGLDGIAGDGLYRAGKAAMTFGGPWLATISAEEGIDYGIAPLPAGPNGSKQSALGVIMLPTTQADDAQLAGIEAFFTWFFQKENMITWSLGSGWPPLTTDVSAAEVDENPVVAALTEQSPNGVGLLPGIAESADVLTAVDNVTQRALAGEDIDALLAEAQAKIESLLAD